MGKFFVKVFILLITLLISLVLLAAIIFLLPPPEDSYNSVIIDKHIILANSKNPKIVLAGGSNLAFGIDSAAIQDRFSIPVVNMGIHVGIGLGRILDDISPSLHTGDVLLIITEYEHFTSLWNGETPAYDLIFNTGQFRLLWSFYYGLPDGDVLAPVLNRLFSPIKNIIWPNKQSEKEKILSVYSRYGFNEYGDSVNHLGLANGLIAPSENLGDINQKYLNNFFRLVDSFTKRGIIVMLSYPCYEEQSFHNNTAFIQELDALFRTKENLLVISTPGSYCFHADYFYDTVYHLNMEGRTARTSQLIHDLRDSGRLPVIE